MALVALATLLGATLQSAAGFGFALVLAPAMLAMLDPSEAISTLLVLGAVLNLLVLFGEGRRRRVLGAEIARLAGWALPGLVIGALVLGAVSRQSLQVAVGALVLVAVATHRRRRRPERVAGLGPGALAATSEDGAGGGASGVPISGDASAAARAATGLATGVLTTTTGTSGPPLVYWLDRIGAAPAELRDTLSASFLGLNVFAAATLLVPGGATLSLEPPLVALLLALTVAGQLLGRAIFARLDPDRFRAIGLAVIVLTGVASIAAGLAG